MEITTPIIYFASAGRRGQPRTGGQKADGTFQKLQEHRAEGKPEAGRPEAGGGGGAGALGTQGVSAVAAWKVLSRRGTALQALRHPLPGPWDPPAWGAGPPPRAAMDR